MLLKIEEPVVELFTGLLVNVFSNLKQLPM